MNGNIIEKTTYFVEGVEFDSRAEAEFYANWSPSSGFNKKFLIDSHNRGSESKADKWFWLCAQISKLRSARHNVDRLERLFIDIEIDPDIFNPTESE